MQEAQKKQNTEKVNYMISSSGSRRDTVEKNESNLKFYFHIVVNLMGSERK